MTFADLAKRKDVWQSGLEGWNVKDSEFLTGVRNEAVSKNTKGKLLRALQLRLQNRLPRDLVAAVNESENMEQLESWFDLSQTANSLAEFRTSAGI